MSSECFKIDNIQRARGSAEIRMKSLVTFGSDECALVFGAEDDVDVEAEVG
jgi:hypothetical protein